MKVQINNKNISLFDGAKVQDAVRMYYSAQGKKAPNPLPEIKDAYGNPVGEDGALSPGTRLYVGGASGRSFFRKIILFFK